MIDLKSKIEELIPELSTRDNVSAAILNVIVAGSTFQVQISVCTAASDMFIEQTDQHNELKTTAYFRGELMEI